MATKSLLKQPKQKIIYSKDNGMDLSGGGFTGDPTVLQLFHSTSSLARSIRKQPSTDASSSLKSSAALILGQSQKIQEPSVAKASFKASVSSTSKDIKIRNIIHDYTNIDVNHETYKILSTLRSEKRMRNLDILDDYEVWKTKYAKDIEEEIKEKISELKSHLDSTQNEIYSKFTMKDAALIPLIQKDIDDISNFYHDVIKGREENIEDALKYSIDKLNECFQNVKLKIVTLGKDLDLTGYLLEEEIEKIIQDKTQYITNLVTCKKNLYNRVIIEVKNSEKEIVEKSQKDLIEFILRWKNVKLNNYLNELKEYLKSEQIVDNKARYDLIENLKKDQMDIYNQRKELIFETLFKLPFEQITSRNIERINKELEDIEAKAEAAYTNHVNLLTKNSDEIEQLSKDQIEQFKANVNTVSYDFTKDNHNEKKYNDYDDLNSIQELIDKEIGPITTQNEVDRKNYMSQLNQYIDEYDGYVNSVAAKMIGFYLALGKLFDEHRQKLVQDERDYAIALAKAGDNDEDIIHEKEEALKKIIDEMRNCINKTELDKGLEGSFKIMDELEVEYRDYFKIVEELFNSHDGRLLNTFHDYEIKALQLFGIYIKDKIDEIQNRRNIESNFLSKKREAEIAIEEAKKAEEEAKEAEKLGKKAKPAKKQEKKPALKKGEVPPPLVPPRAIEDFKSKLGFDYLVDFNIGELIRHYLRNIIYNRDDDIFELKPKSKEELERIAKEKEEREKAEKEKAELAAKGKKPASRDSKKKKDAQSSQPSSPNETNIDFYNAFDPYNADSKKVFISPTSATNKKLLSEENMFDEENLTNGLNELFNNVTDKIVANHQRQVDKSKEQDNEFREERLSELDIRLKSLAPRKGKIEVEEYDKRLSEIEKHEEKLEKHKENIENKNKKDIEDNDSLLSKISTNFSNLQSEYEKLAKGIEEEENSKGLEDKFKKFKTTYYDFLSQLHEDEINLKQFSEDNPNGLLNSNKNFLLSLLPMSKGGTYSDREIEHTKGVLKDLDENVIQKSMEERKKKNQETLEDIKKKCEEFLADIQKKYDVSNENIMAKDGVGKKFGVPKRLVNDIIINIKIKCHQAQEGLDKLYKDLNDLVKAFNSIKDITKLNDSLKKNVLPIQVRMQLSRINNCVFCYGKYIEAFKENIVNGGYALSRVLMKEDVESCAIVNKEDIDSDEKLKTEELMSLGFLAKIILEGAQPAQGNAKGKGNANSNEPSFNNEMSSIDDKVKAECAKIYVGNFAKYLNQTEKIPDSLIPFLANIKLEMEQMRLKCVRDLRTFCQNLYKFSEDIPKCVIKFIYLYSSMVNKEESDNLIGSFNETKNKSDKIRTKLNDILGPYLANPYYKGDLEKITKEDNDRSSEYIKKINETQFSLIENEEKCSKNFTVRLLNNFESLLTLFDNFIFEEEFISLGDEEYFKKRQNYNELLKLKQGIQDMANAGAAQGGKNVKAQNLDASNFNLDSKRTFKKIYKGLNFNEGKINYYNLFTKQVCDVVENSEEKIKFLETEYNKEDYSKNITGIKLQNNKNLFINRNDYYKVHCEEFNKNIMNDLDKYNKDRLEELEYKKKWDNTMAELKKAIDSVDPNRKREGEPEPKQEPAQPAPGNKNKK